MVDENLELKLSIETDSSIQKAIKDMESVSNEASAIEKGLAKVSRSKAFDELARDAAKLATETDDSANATKLLVRELDKLGAKENEVEKVVRQYQRLQTEIKSATSAQDRFDATSKKVALAGDAQSNLGALSGLAGAAGAGDASSALSIGGEGLALLEELPRLKEAFKGLPDVARASAQSLGTNVARMGALGVAAAALTVVWNLARAAAEENAKVIREELDAQDARRELAIDFKYATDEQIASTIRAIEIEKEKAQANKDASDAQMAAVEGLNPVVRGIAELMSFLGIADQSLSEIRADNKQETEELEAIERELSDARKAVGDAGKNLETIESSIANQHSKSAQEAQKATSSLDKMASSTSELASTAMQASNAIQQASNGMVNSQALVRDGLGRGFRSGGSGGITFGGSVRRGRSSGSSSSGGSSAVAEAANAFAESANSARETLYDSITGINDGLNDGIEDLRINQERDRADAFSSGNFLALREISKQAGRAAEDLNRNASRDRLRAEQDYNSQLMTLQNQRQQVMLQSAQNFSKQMVATFNAGVRSISGKPSVGIRFVDAPR